jgi:hypothetical protein
VRAAARSKGSFSYPARDGANRGEWRHPGRGWPLSHRCDFVIVDGIPASSPLR